MSGPTPDRVRETLATVSYPGFSRDIVSFGMVREVTVENGAVSVRLAVTTADPQVVGQIRDQILAAVQALPGVASVEVDVQRPGPARLPAAGEAPARPPGPSVERIIGVASGKGGVGKSTVAVNLAVALANRGRRVGFLDADVHGPSAPLMFGLEGRKPDQGDDEGRPIPLSAFGVSIMSMGFFVERDSAVIWRGPIVGNFIRQLLNDVAWGDLDDLIVDFPPGTGDAQLTISQSVKMAGSIVVTTPNDLALVDALKAISMFRKVEIPLLGLVENMSHFVCPHCHETTEIFGKGRVDAASKSHGVPLIGRVPIDPEVVAESDRGVPVVVSRPDSAAAKAYMEIARKVDESARPPAEPGRGAGAFLDRFGR